MLLKNYNEFYEVTKGVENFQRYIRKCDIVIIRKGCAMSKPCTRCTKNLKNYNLRRVYYSFDGTHDLKMEKVNQIETCHVSRKYKKSWSEF